MSDSDFAVLNAGDVPHDLNRTTSKGRGMSRYVGIVSQMQHTGNRALRRSGIPSYRFPEIPAENLARRPE